MTRLESASREMMLPSIVVGRSPTTAKALALDACVGEDEPAPAASLVVLSNCKSCWRSRASGNCRRGAEDEDVAMSLPRSAEPQTTAASADCEHPIATIQTPSAAPIARNPR